MIGLVIATHAGLAEQFVGACEMIIGPQQNVRAVGIHREDGVEEIRQGIRQAVDDVGRDGEGVIVMTDMFGGTPANVSLAFLAPGNIEVLTGVNLPMVLKFCGSRGEHPLTELAGLLKAYGQQSISLASEFLQK